MQSKEFWETREFWELFARIGVTSGLIFALGFSWLYSIETGWPFSYVFNKGGLLFFLLGGVITGLGGAYNLRPISLSISFEDKKTFLSQLTMTLAEIHCDPIFQDDSSLLFKPSFQAGGPFAGRIAVQIQERSVSITGPAMPLKKLQQRIGRGTKAVGVTGLSTFKPMERPLPPSGVGEGKKLFCRQCGDRLGEGDRFCSSCGTQA